MNKLSQHVLFLHIDLLIHVVGHVVLTKSTWIWCKNALEEYKQESIDAATKVAEKTADEISKKSTIELKGKGNKNQLQFCQDVEARMDSAVKRIDSKDYQAAKEELQEGKKLIKKRIKLIRLADREDWSLVNEYMSDNMASKKE